MLYSKTGDYGVSRGEGNFKMSDMHYHNSYEMYYLEAGSREYFIEDKLFSVSAGNFVLIPPGKLHRTGGEYGIRVLVYFTEAFLRRFFTAETIRELLRCFENYWLILEEDQQKNCVKLLEQLQKSRDELSFSLALGNLLRELRESRGATMPEDPVSRMANYINKNYAQIHNLTELADAFYISKYHLCRVFKAGMKMTVVEYVNRVRIKNACNYLKKSDKGMDDIAELCGFQSAAYFSNVFRRYMDMSPTAYRNR